VLECPVVFLTAFMGTLYVVATPIGNLADFSPRGQEILGSVDLILSEDTRETSKLLNRYQIEASQMSYRDQNHERVVDQILNLLKEGKDLALVSDSGTPLISDPGFKLVSEIHAQGGKVVTIPGPSAVTAALSIAGLPTDKFVFLGFLPKKTSQIEKVLNTYSNLDATLVIYESPFRVRKLLEAVHNVLGNRCTTICRELTKVHEEVITGNVADLKEAPFKEKGEFVVLVAKEGFLSNA